MEVMPVSWPTRVKKLPRKRYLRREVVSRPKDAQDFHMLPKRRVVERTFAWLGNFRRLSKDCEVKTSHSEAVICIASVSLMARRLAKSASN